MENIIRCCAKLAWADVFIIFMTIVTQMIPSLLPTLKRSHLTLSPENYFHRGLSLITGQLYYILLGLP